MKNARNILDSIAACLEDEVEAQMKSPQAIDPGLYSGLAGITLFFSRYRLHAARPDRFEALHDRALSACLERLGDGFRYPTFCSGLAGILYLLRREYASTVDTADSEAVYDGYLQGCLRSYLEADYWDFMHGALGIGIYYLLRDDGTPVHAAILDYLESNSLTDGPGRRLLSVTDHQSGRRGYNIALSHGLSSVVAYLARLYELSADRRAAGLLEGFVDYILDQRIDFDRYGSCFPSMSRDEGSSRSRLAWCYGDLGVASALYRAGVSAGNDRWRDTALEVFDLACGRRDLKANYVLDAGVCHGTAGIALIFKQMFLLTGRSGYNEAADYWLGQVLEMSCFPDGAAGYKRYSGTDKTWDNCYSLLEGVAGVGLVLLTFLYGESWADLLLL